MCITEDDYEEVNASFPLFNEKEFLLFFFLKNEIFFFSDWLTCAAFTAAATTTTISSSIKRNFGYAKKHGQKSGSDGRKDGFNNEENFGEKLKIF